MSEENPGENNPLLRWHLRAQAFRLKSAVKEIEDEWDDFQEENNAEFGYLIDDDI